jgi:hypothetical protein
MASCTDAGPFLSVIQSRHAPRRKLINGRASQTVPAEPLPLEAVTRSKQIVPHARRP